MTRAKTAEPEGYAFDGLTPMRWLVSEIVKGGDSPPSLSELASRYQHGHGTGDLSRVMLHEKLATEAEANAFIVRQALTRLGDQVTTLDDGALALTVPVEKLRYDGRKIHLFAEEPEAPWPGGREPFNPGSGIFTDNIRSLLRDNMDELRESMRKFGWLKELPRVVDERGTILVGNRRTLVAKELGLPEPWPQIDIELGRGDEADAYRLKLAIASNIGGKELTKGDRERIAKYLYGELHWSMERVGEALGVHKSTISRGLPDDLPDLLHDATNQRVAKDGTKRGRRKGSTNKPKLPVKLPEADLSAAQSVLAGEKSAQKAADDIDRPRLAVRTAVVYESGRLEGCAALREAIEAAYEFLATSPGNWERGVEMLREALRDSDLINSEP